MLTIENTTVIANIDLRAGMYVQDDIMCRIDAVVYADETGVCLSVEDGNGYYYTITRRFEGFTRTFLWSAEDWAAYRAL